MTLENKQWVGAGVDGWVAEDGVDGTARGGVLFVNRFWSDMAKEDAPEPIFRSSMTDILENLWQCNILIECQVENKFILSRIESWKGARTGWRETKFFHYYLSKKCLIEFLTRIGEKGENLPWLTRYVFRKFWWIFFTNRFYLESWVLAQKTQYKLLG